MPTVSRDDANERRTFGVWYDDDGNSVAQTLELHDANNQPGISRIPAGTYPLRYYWSPRHQESKWHIDGVPGRSGIEVDIANKASQLLGCVAVGDTRDGDELDSSADAYNRLTAGLDPTKTYSLTITDPPTEMAA